ncbi:unnamed protein product [Thelazia callipaeda]|uniref:SSD domain-containing protein n=1 Tax=Thelazia callipaeda TaxID=103827 RepID=A0A0N5CPY1_THECL|nr:unnamed protein product [Thelazia callipaeda]
MNHSRKKIRKREVTVETIKIIRNYSEASTADYYSYDDQLYDYHSGGNRTKNEKLNEEMLCSRYVKSFLEWMNNNKNLWSEFLAKRDMPVYPNYGEIMTGGCQGFARKTMVWPEDLIIGGIKRQNNKLLSAEAFQSVFLVASGNDIFLRYKDEKSKLKPNLNAETWNPYFAAQVVSAWQRNFTEYIYQHRWNTKVNRQIHPLSSTSLEDMLKEFSQFKFLVIFLGYFFMFIYAGWSQLHWDGWWFAVDSSVGLGIFGVFLIVPFLTLGLGVDDMFLLLHNYNDVRQTVKHNEIGVLMKETGMSIVITSINNVISFMAGTLLPIPALKSFCSQTAILLAFNMLAIMVIYPAIIAIDLRRRKAGRRDMGCCCIRRSSLSKKVGVESLELKMGKQVAEGLTISGHIYPGPPHTPTLNNEDENYKWYTFNGFLQCYYVPFLSRPLTKLMVIVIWASMFLFGCVGLYQSTLGLELSDVLPEGTAPAAFLKAREQYFSFYPMFIILKGNGINFAKQQEQIEQFRLDIAKSSYVIKVKGHASEEYWLSLMRTWLTSIQKHLDDAIKKGKINAVTGEIVPNAKLTDEAKIARRLVCSYGKNYNCTGRVGKIKLVDNTGLINHDGFYNYLTGWYNVDNMMYYVSQAAFYPTPPSWMLDSQEKAVPPAEPPAYSQMMFYLTDLIDTPVIVKMIREIRSICERYTEMGLPNFPSGIAFTFWEQYLNLSWNLFVAICVIACAVFITISMLICNPWAAVMVMIIVVSMTIELAGFMSATGVKLNPVSAVILVTAVGIGVEFTAHVVLAYLTSLGNKNERMATCLNHMFIPVMHGGLSTLLGIIMLAFSEFEFIVKYFFVVLSALIIIGLLNGLVLLPIHPLDEKVYLPVPSPLCKQEKHGHSSSRNSDISMKVRVGGAFVEMQVNGGKKTAAESHGFRPDSLSSISEEPFDVFLQNNRLYTTSSDLKRTSAIIPSVSSSSLSEKCSKGNSELRSTHIPVGVIAPKRSTSPLLSGEFVAKDNKSERCNLQSNNKSFKFASNALRF